MSSDGSVDLYATASATGAFRPAGRYSGLHVEDATGRALDARLAVVGGAVAIEVDDSSAMYPIVVDPIMTLALQNQFMSPNGGQFGFSVSVDGDTAVVGAPSVASGTGAAYVFGRSGTVWSAQQTLLGATGDIFGLSVSVKGNTLFIGAAGNNLTYVYTRNSISNPWLLAQQLVPHNPAGGDLFGFSVALGANTAIIGASNKSGSAGAVNVGAAYVFVNTSGTWQEQAEITANDGIANDLFGLSVAISNDGNTALVGAPSGANGTFVRNGAYFFSKNGTTWTQSQRVFVPGAGVRDSFGGALAFVGGTAFIGAPGTHTNDGAAYPFVNVGGTWEQLTAVPGSVASGEQFGTSVAFDGTTALIGAVGSRAAYVVLSNSPGVWSKQQQLSEPSPGFGQSVALSSTTPFTALIGATLNGVVGDPGAAYVFVPGSSPVPALGGKAPALGLALALGVLSSRRRRPTAA